MHFRYFHWIFVGLTIATTVSCGSKAKWDGWRTAYCQLDFDVVPFSPSSSSSLETKVQTLLSEGKIQEAVWILESDPSQNAKSDELKSKLRSTFETETYTLTDELKLAGANSKVMLKFPNDTIGIAKTERPDDPWVSISSEVAAYELDQLLQTGLVPMTVKRLINGEMASVQYIVRGMSTGSADNVTAKNFSVLYVFDYIIGNQDRQAANFLFWSSENRLIGIDHGASFRETECATREKAALHLASLPRLKQRIQSISETEIRAKLSPILSKNILDLVISRIKGLK